MRQPVNDVVTNAAIIVRLQFHKICWIYLMFFLFLRFVFGKPSAQSFHEVVSVFSRVKLRDIDTNLHLTNSRYLLYLDRGRVSCMFEIDILKRFIRAKIGMVVSSINITYVREIKPFEKFEIKSAFLGWDDKYIYFSQEIYVGDQLRSTAMSRTCPLYQGKALAPMVAFEKVGLDVPCKPLPKLVVEWSEGLKARREGLG